jgi:signal transduction histidine kinase
MRADLRQRPILAISVTGLSCAVLVLAAGWLAERARLGVDERASYVKVDAEVRAEFDRIAASLLATARDEAGLAVRVLGAPREERDLRPLFDRAQALVSRDPTEPLALTVYGTDGLPLAWAGRASELAQAQDRMSGPAALFVAPGPLGFRLVWLEPVNSPDTRPPIRLGVVACERLFSEQSAVGRSGPREFSIDTSIVPVSLRTRYEGAGERLGPTSFLINSPSGEPLVEGTVAPGALEQARRQHRQIVLDLAIAVLGLTVVLLVGPLLDLRALARSPGGYLGFTLGSLALVVGARGLFSLATPPGGTELFSGDLYRWPALGPLGRHPVDFLLTALAALAVVSLLAGPVERVRLASRDRRRTAFSGGHPRLLFVTSQAIAGALLALAVIGDERFLAGTFRRTSVDILYFSPHPWHHARMAMAFGFVFAHAAFAWTAVLGLRLALARCRFRRGNFAVGITVVASWSVGAAGVWAASWNGPLKHLPRLEALLIVAALAVAAVLAPRSLVRLRHASQGFRLTATFLALLAPAFVTYPSLVHFASLARRRVVETVYGPEVLKQREVLQQRLEAAQTEIDAREAALEAYVSVPAPPLEVGVRTDSAFLMWQGTALERYRVSSAVELFNADGMLVSRFALNLPELTRRQGWHEQRCTWNVFGEVSPFGAHERQLLHAGRNICAANGAVLGTIVVHVILDNSTLSFISSQNPYLELLRGQANSGPEEVPGHEIEFVYYGWSRTPVYLSSTEAWLIDDALFARISGSREPFWTRLLAENGAYDVYVENDRAGFYALGYLRLAPIGHCINLAELMALVGLAYLAILVGSVAFRVVGLRRVRPGRALLREIRESFYRKLFLAFVAASVIPVVTLALVTRAYIADRLRHEVESAAHKTTVIARQIIEDYTVAARQTLEDSLLPQPEAFAALVTDDTMVGLSRVVGQDVNIFLGARLQATSERDLFASGLLPARTPAEIYRAIVFDRMPTKITEEQAAGFRYMVAAAPVRAAGRDAILTIPLTLRQQEIEREIDDLNRRIVLAAMLFILVGAAIGYTMAERIADPVNRLTRATRRIAKGNFDARILAASSDELGRLMEAFNLMLAQLQQQRSELERTHRLEAWAEMARQVAHEIKNPLTPIQLSAEHLLHVHADRGKPLGPILDGCVDSILSQVRLLRQIASEFSSFASSPTPRLGPASLADLVDEVVRPYTPGASARVQFRVDVPGSLPPVMVDRMLIGRALTNVIDNALHAMPGGGTLSIAAQVTPAARVEMSVTDTGVGMDEEALRRLFEPYFSTKAVGTGLGLSIARRNVELNHGTIAVHSRRGQGTRVTLTLPLAAADPT